MANIVTDEWVRKGEDRKNSEYAWWKARETPPPPNKVRNWRTMTKKGPTSQ